MSDTATSTNLPTAELVTGFMTSELFTRVIAPPLQQYVDAVQRNEPQAAQEALMDILRGLCSLPDRLSCAFQVVNVDNYCAKAAESLKERYDSLTARNLMTAQDRIVSLEKEVELLREEKKATQEMSHRSLEALRLAQLETLERYEKRIAALKEQVELLEVESSKDITLDVQGILEAMSDDSMLMLSKRPGTPYIITAIGATYGLLGGLIPPLVRVIDVDIQDSVAHARHQLDLLTSEPEPEADDERLPMIETPSAP